MKHYQDSRAAKKLRFLSSFSTNFLQIYYITKFKNIFLIFKDNRCA